MAKVQWRKWNRLIHRDLGYLCVGLTVVYAVSGVAVNHIRDWNPNYQVTESSLNVGPVTADNPRDPETVETILRTAGLETNYRDTFRRDEVTLDIFLDGGRVTVDLPSGDAVVETVKDRRGLQEMNFLHLNQPRGLWTYMADLYAVALVLLGVTGLFVIKGKKGITGRGAWLTTAGVLIPVVFLWLYR
jgi:hypothetical protein